MDRDDWMYRRDRTDPTYMIGVQSFLTAAEAHRVNVGAQSIFCPCAVCKNFQTHDIKEIKFHLLKHGFRPRYTCWSKHGESLDDRSTSSINLDNENTTNNEQYTNQENDTFNDGNDNFNDMYNDLETNIEDSNQEKLRRLFEDSEKPLYNGCKKYSKLSAVLKWFALKSKHRWSDKSFTDALVLLHDMLPDGNELPVSVYQAKKLTCPMGLKVKRIHACPNDCMLYTKEFKDDHKCFNCGASRYKNKNETSEVDDDVKKNGPPAKVLWYFPIIPRLKRLFANEKEAKLLRWHSEDRINDGKLRHVADSPQWRNIDYMYPEFGNEIRNIRFGLSSDGINPFGQMSNGHSTWPVLLCIYNLPPWLCMKKKYIMMSLLIAGPRQPGNDIDVYLSPLIDDLKKLWSRGVNVYDSYKKEYFILRAMIFCTISDFPAYSNLSGYSTKGYKACPVCEDDTSSIRLKKSRKIVYMGHRRFLPPSHRYRNKKREFNGKTEHEEVRRQFDAFDRVKNLNVVLGKRPRAENEKGIWKKKSIFWDLPYWEHLQVRHCLDVMHIEKNVCDSLIGLLLNIPGKTKDGIEARRDMQEMGIREELAPVPVHNGFKLPPACYTMSKKEKKMFCECLHGIKVPSNYSANIKRLVSLKDNKLRGMKSHDCHVLMTHMIPIAIRGLLPEKIRHTITKLCLFFNMIHSKVIDPQSLDSLQKEIIMTLCELEMYFPPSFFDVMVHLVVHIVGEIKSCGPVFLRYMYPFERYMGFLKAYVRNRNRPEGSIVEGYTSEEVTEFCIGYLDGVNSIGVPQSRHSGRLEGKGGVGMETINPTYSLLQLAHFVVLKHMTCIAPYVHEHMKTLRSTYRGKTSLWYENKHNEEFASWMRTKVTTNGSEDVDLIVKNLGRGPDMRVTSYKGYDINGYTFYTKDQDAKSTMQNSGVTVIATSTQFDRMNHDTMLKIAKDSYYGVIQEIWELDYSSFTIPVFKCKWVDNHTGVKVDNYGFTLVDLNTNGYVSEPFVLAKLVTQVFFVNDPSKPKWDVVLQGKRRILGVDNVVDEEEYNQFDDLPPFSVGIDEPVNDVTDGAAAYLRSDHNEHTYVDG